MRFPQKTWNDDGAGKRSPFGNDILHEDLKGLPGTAAQIMQKLSIIEKVPAQDLRDAEDEVPVGNFFQDTCA